MEKYEKAVLDIVELKNDVIRTSGCSVGVISIGLGGSSLTDGGTCGDSCNDQW